MTLLLSRLTSENSIVLSADTMVLNDDRTVFSDSEQKIFQLIDEIYWSVAATGIYPSELKQLNQYLTQNLTTIARVVPTYTMVDIAMLFSEMVRRWFEVNVRDNLHTDFILAGFSKSSSGYSNPQIYTIISNDNLIPRLSKGSVAIGDIDEKFRARFTSMSAETNAYIKQSQTLIYDVAKITPSVGGSVDTVIINGATSKKRTKRLLK